MAAVLCCRIGDGVVGGVVVVCYGRVVLGQLCSYVSEGEPLCRGCVVAVDVVVLVWRVL